MKTTAAFSRLWRFTDRVRLAFEPPALVATRAPRIGLCLSSGGARGLAHVGVIQVLEENHVPITAIAGSSMGAYVGALWAAGVSGAKLEELAREIKNRRALLNLLDPVFPPTVGLIRGDKLRRHLERTLGAMTFAELRTPLLVVATDLATRAPHLFDEGPVAAAVHASSAIPGICAPVLLNGRHYTDGGTAQPLPVRLLRERFEVDRVLAVNLVPTPLDFARDQQAPPPPSRNPLRWLWQKFNLMADGNVIDTFQRSLLSAQMNIAAVECTRADVVLHPAFDAFAWQDFEHYDRYIKAGREAALAALPEIMALTRNNPPSKGGGYYETTASHTTLGLVRR